MSHASIPAEVRAARGLPDHLVRISVGMEHPQDLLQGDHTAPPHPPNDFEMSAVCCVLTCEAVGMNNHQDRLEANC